MNTIRCKFRCSGIEDDEEGSVVEFDAVTDGSKENEQFFKYTPFGTLRFGIIDTKLAHAMFEVGKEYYLDISPDPSK